MVESNNEDLNQLVVETFPEINKIDESNLREKVISVWTTAIEDNNIQSVTELPWGAYHDDIDDEYQVEHIREVTQHAISMMNQMAKHRPNINIDQNAVVAAALLHDVSKLYEMSGESLEFSELAKWLPHPLMAVYLCNLHDIPLHIQRAILAHTHQTSLQPLTIEGQLVKLADLATVEALSWEHRHHPHNQIDTEHYTES